MKITYEHHDVQKTSMEGYKNLKEKIPESHTIQNHMCNTLIEVLHVIESCRYTSNIHILIAKDALGEILGSTTFFSGERDRFQNEITFLGYGSLYVEKEFRNSGIGMGMVKKIGEIMKEYGVSRYVFPDTDDMSGSNRTRVYKLGAKLLDMGYVSEYGEDSKSGEFEFVLPAPLDHEKDRNTFF